MLTQEFTDKVKAFCSAVREAQNAYRKIHYSSLPEIDIQADTDTAKKFCRIVFVDSSSRSSRYFVEVATGNIYACEGWKKPNVKRFFGTLDEVAEFDWSGYEGIAKPDSKYKMRRLSHYSTAELK